MMAIEIDTMPYPAGRYFASKYDHLFERMVPGQCLKMESDQVGKVAHAMNKWVKKNGKQDELIVRTMSKNPDKKGRVWLLNKPKPGLKMADVPKRTVSKLVG